MVSSTQQFERIRKRKQTTSGKRNKRERREPAAEADGEPRAERVRAHEGTTAAASPGRGSRTIASQRRALPTMTIATHTRSIDVTVTFTKPVVYVAGSRIIGR